MSDNFLTMESIQDAVSCSIRMNMERNEREKLYLIREDHPTNCKECKLYSTCHTYFGSSVCITKWERCS